MIEEVQRFLLVLLGELVVVVPFRHSNVIRMVEFGIDRGCFGKNLKSDSDGVNESENYMLHLPDMRANYLGLWTEADNLAYSRDMELLK
jgi:hypothetical protein